RPIGDLRADPIDDAIVFVEGQRHEDERDAKQCNGAQEPDQRERAGGEDNAANHSCHRLSNARWDRWGNAAESAIALLVSEHTFEKVAASDRKSTRLNS